MTATALALAAALAAGAEGRADAEYRAGLDLVYDGSIDAGLERLAATAAENPRDPMGPYLQALGLVWRIEQRPEATDHDRDFQRLVDRAIEIADARLREDDDDVRPRLVRGAAHGVRSRLALFRGHRRDAAREAVRMREDLLAVRRLDPEDRDALFGVGLYDYYADVLPRIAKVMRFFMGLPGGDRERGLARIEEARASLLHETEVAAQLYEIYAFYEQRPERAHEEIRGLRRRYPGSPLWALKLAEHECHRMGLYADSAAVAREILAACERGHPNYAPVVAAMARVALGEALLLDLRLAEARRVLLEAREAMPDAPWITAKGHLLLGRALELEGDRDGAEPHYRIAAGAADRDLRRQAEAALERPIPKEQVRATPFLAEGRRLRESGRSIEATRAYRDALQAWPRSREAALRVAEDELREGHVARARELAAAIAPDEELQPPWVRPWSALLRAHLDDVSGERGSAILEYKKVLEEPLGQEEVRSLAARGIAQPFHPEAHEPEPHGRPKH
jgi:tetratricopeptide (TPR) repeat protein